MAAQDILIDLTGTGDTTLIAAPGARQFIRVYNYHLSGSATSIVTWKSAANKKAVDYLFVGNSLNIADPVNGIFDCNNGEALVINNSAASVGGCLKYAILGQAS